MGADESRDLLLGAGLIAGASLLGVLAGAACRVAGADGGKLVMSLVAFGWPAAAVWVFFIIRGLHR